MLRNTTHSKFMTVLAVGGVLTGLSLYGCATSSNTPTTQSSVASTEPSFALFGPPPDKTGAQLWADNCMRCHNGRPPQEFSAKQWEAIVHHMRLRADLTGEETRKITAFLQSE